MAWHRVGSIPFSCDGCSVGPIGGELNGLVGFENGYVVLDGRAGAVWHSSDGRSWKRVRLPFEGSRAKASDANGLLGRAIATNGRKVLIVGGYSHAPCALTEPGSTGGGPDCSYNPIAWISDDGVSWRLVYPDAGGEFVAVWPTASGGWVAAASDWYGESLGGRTLWDSADGIAWKRVRPRPPAAWEGYDRVPIGVASDSGRQLLAASERGGSRTTLAAITGGGRWRVLRGFPGRRAEVVAGVAPAGGRTGWLLAGRSGATFDCDGAVLGDDCWGVPTVWSSADGVGWATTRLPVGRGVAPEDPDDDPVQVTAVTSLALTDRGYVAVGAEGGWAGARHETWVSDDGVSWTRLPQTSRPRFDHGPGLVADGPVGLIGISGSDGNELVVWQLR